MEMDIAAIQQKFDGSVVLYEKAPVLFRKIKNDMTAEIFDLLTQEEKRVPFDEKKFRPPTARIGMINSNGSVVYGFRQAVRKFKLGLNRENLVVRYLDDVKYPEGSGTACASRIVKLDSRELGLALAGKYPSLEACLRRVSQLEGAAAFDKQFCVDTKQRVFYKQAIAGKIVDGKVAFNTGYEHLIVLLEKETCVV